MVEEFSLCTTLTRYYTSGKGYLVTTEYEAGLVPKSVWTLWRREKYHHCQGWNHRSLAFQQQLSHCNKYTKSTLLGLSDPQDWGTALLQNITIYS